MRIAILIALPGVLPVLTYPFVPESARYLFWGILALNLVAWSLVSALWTVHSKSKKQLLEFSKEFGLEEGDLLGEALKEYRRRLKAVSLNLVENRLESSSELADALQRISSLAYELLDATSAELTLFDAESELYNSSFLVGIPKKRPNTLTDNSTPEQSFHVLSEPIAFAGTVMGSIRVERDLNNPPSEGDREALRLLSLQSGLAIVNEQYSKELLRMSRISEESIKAKTGFLANLSHELRGPLGIMLNGVELILEELCGPINEEQRETLDMLKENGEHLLELINDVLDYAKLESGRVVPKKEKLLAHEVLRDICGIVRSQAQKKQHAFILRESTDALAFECERRHIRQMLINMFTNAIKYTPEGGNIDVWMERAPNNRVLLNVKDSGVGIAESDRDKVFSAFERVDHTYSMEQVGTGLGMPLTRKLAELNGATIDFSSSAGEGSHFWLSFPIVDYRPEDQNLETDESVKAAGNGERILILEGDKAEKQMLSKYLAHLGFKPIELDSIEGLLAELEDKKVDLVILGDDFIEEHPNIAMDIKNHRNSSKAPVVLLSGHAFKAEIEDFLKKGVDRLIAKPVPLTQLGASCRNLIDGARGFSTASAAKKSPKEKQLSGDISDDDMMH